MPRDDAGQFASNHIGPKKRPAYETGSEKIFERVANSGICAVTTEKDLPCSPGCIANFAA